MCAWSGGSFTRTNGTYTGASVWASDQGAGVNITSARADIHDQDLATGINQCVNKDGSNATNVVTATWIANNAVTTNKIADANITEAKLADDAASRSTLLGYFYVGAAGTGTIAPDAMALSGASTVTKSVSPKTCKITHLTMNLSGSNGSGTNTATLYKDGSTTSQSISISSFLTVGAVQAITAQSFSALEGIQVYSSTSSVGNSVGVLVGVWGHFTE